jgi:hypothetical protein
VTKVAIIGSCITRDIWPILEEPAPELLYLSRTSLPSLVSEPVEGLEPIPDQPQGGISRSQRNSVLADLQKTALDGLAAFQPTHIILDFIDERFDLLQVGRSIITHSWDLQESGYLAQPWAADARRIPRTSEEARALWRSAAPGFVEALRRRGLLTARIVLHEAEWARTYVDTQGRRQDLPDALQVWEGLPASRTEHNALLADTQARIDALIHGLVRVRADPRFRVADETHRWGLSPFHYVADYYRDVLRQLKTVGI